MLKLENLELLKKRKNLLAFSAGVDSSALLFLLLEQNITFDIAFVNYGLREQSKEEEAYAKELAERYKLKVHITHAPKFKNNFEKNARDFRYAFFDGLMKEYENLLTAHQLNDQLEWFLMRLTKGAGTSELLGLETLSQREEYTLLRPLLRHSKRELLNYLKVHQYHYFVDESNIDEKYERNYFRNNFSDRLLEEYKEGIEKSFSYLREEKKILNQGIKELFHEKEFYLLTYAQKHQVVRVVDSYLKKLGYLLSASQRAELKKENALVFGGLWAVEILESSVFIAPYRTSPMSKKFKERCRVKKIPPKVRAYLFEENINIF